LAAGVGLNINMLGAKEFLRPGNCQVFALVNKFIAAIITLPPPDSFRIFVGLESPQSFEYAAGNKFSEQSLLGLPLAVYFRHN
jgi:hypothetical protein